MAVTYISKVTGGSTIKRNNYKKWARKLYSLERR